MRSVAGYVAKGNGKRGRKKAQNRLNKNIKKENLNRLLYVPVPKGRYTVRQVEDILPPSAKIYFMGKVSTTAFPVRPDWPMADIRHE